MIFRKGKTIKTVKKEFKNKIGKFHYEDRVGRGLAMGHFTMKQAQLGEPDSDIQVEPGLILQVGTCQILNFSWNP